MLQGYKMSDYEIYYVDHSTHRDLRMGGIQKVQRTLFEFKLLKVLKGPNAKRLS